MRKSYSREFAQQIKERLLKGESIQKIHEETGVSKPTLWRWKTGKSFPSEGLSVRNPKLYYHLRYLKKKHEILSRKLNGNYLKALERDDYKCQVCFNHFSKKLVVHHIDGDRQNNDLSNLVTLCQVCHRQIHLLAFILKNKDKQVIPYGKIYEYAMKLVK